MIGAFSALVGLMLVIELSALIPLSTLFGVTDTLDHNIIPSVELIKKLSAEISYERMLAIRHLNRQTILEMDKVAGDELEAVVSAKNTLLHILGRDRLAIVKARLRPQAEGGGQSVRCHAHILGQQAVTGRRLVHAAQ